MTAENYPAPYAVPYIVGTPAAKLEDCNLDEGAVREFTDGTFAYEHETFQAYYDAEGNLTSYYYGNLEGTKIVEYDVDGNLLLPISTLTA